MNDKLIFSDGSTLYITLESKVRTWVKFLLIAVNIGLYCLPILLLLNIQEKAVLAVPIMSIAFFLMVTKPTLWNLFGRECMVITKENFSYYRDFGLYKTPIKNTVIDHGLMVYPQNELVYEDEPYIIITFCEYLPNGESREILTTSIKTPEKNYKTIQKLLDGIFYKPEDSYQFSLN